MKILVFDNYDSFTYNLVHLVEKIIHGKVEVHRNDQIPLEKVKDYDKIILSPGPGIPEEAGLLLPLIKEYAPSKSILGVCLGHQAIGQAFGGTLTNLSTVYHGIATPVTVNKSSPLFAGLPNILEVGRYHSWVIDKKDFPAALEITAEDDNGYIMALQSKNYDVQGVQFHPESVLTPQGEAIIRNWLKIKMKKILQYLFEHKTLSRESAREVLLNIGKSVYNEHEVTAFMTVYLMRSVTIEELQGFRDALLELCVKVDLNGHEVTDIVGTGGDGKNTFNISTLSCFIVAGTGNKVAKHGNYGASSISGASNVMEQLGYKFTNDSTVLKKQVEDSNICFMHAPLFHPALKAVGPIRKNLGVRTFFNMLGPMVNPASPAYQLVGVYSLEMARIYNYLLQETGGSFTIIHSLDGYDEISLTGDTKVITNAGERIMTPEQIGKRMVTAQDIYGGNTTEEAARIFLKILKGEGSFAQNAVVLANAAMALNCTRKYKDYHAAYHAAVESLESGKAYGCLQKLIS